jgi:hypothetical protein
MTDRGLAALAAAVDKGRDDDHQPLLTAWDGSCDYWLTSEQIAAAILGERGVFLPDGLPIPADCMAPDVHHEWTGPMRSCGCPNAREQAATIATLRGAYREAADWITAVQSHYVLGPEASPEDIFMVAGERQEAEIATLRTALEADTIEIIRLQHEWANANGDAMREADEAHATITALRAALDGLRADDLWLGVELHAVGNLMFPEPMVSASGARAAILAALDAAKGLS